MKLKAFIATTILSATVLAGPATAWSCNMAGENTHVGQVTGVDQHAKTFTIQDAETNKPITFSAPDSMLKTIAKSQRVTVSFAKKGDALVANSIKL